MGKIYYQLDFYERIELEPTAHPAMPARTSVSSITRTKIASYCYDANRNMTSDDGRTTTYSSFSKPVQIARTAKIFCGRSYPKNRSRQGRVRRRR